MKYLFLLISLLATRVSGQFIPPIEGTEYKDWFITNYVDRDKDRSDSLDYRCGPLTYDGHRGTDFMIRGFPQMDSGVFVIAAASGVVSYTHDGEFDRSKQEDTGGLGNLIIINHGDSLFTFYGHLRKHSLLVKVGDSVIEGQRIGLVGSSGKSPDPHVHFEVHKNGWVVDPFGRACEKNPSVEALFKITPEYHNELHYITSAVASGRFGYDSIREHPRQYLFSSRDSFITYWVLGLSIPRDSKLRADWYSPSGNLWHSEIHTMREYYNYWYHWTSIYGPAIQKNMSFGTWHVELFIEDKLFDSITFSVRK